MKPEDWQRLSYEERLLNRQFDFREEIKKRLAFKQGVWGRTKLSLNRIMSDPLVEQALRSTLDESSLIGVTLREAMDQVKNRLEAVERVPPIFPGGLPGLGKKA